ncbi:MAG: M48 family metalloprotease [Muribaculaceae bacterium]|nr:M48 family metalloprotease [Muribaculaceae bacterium]
MKKVLLSLFAVVLIAVPSFAASYNSAAKVPAVGENILKKNNIPTANVKFTVVSGEVDNSDFATNKVVNVSSADLAFAGNDNEVAAVVANELGHIISGHASKGKVKNLLQAATGTNVATNDTASALVANYTSSKEEKEADILAADLMVAAGYNPLAIIVVLTKQTGTYWETIQGKPANADRALSAYNYISYAHPDKLKAGYGCSEYKNFVAYAAPIVAERKANKKAESKLTKELAKSKKNSVSQIVKFRTRGGLSGWDAAYGLLNGAQ